MSKQKIRGLIQVYTGDGKGKTTAALGQGLRSVGRGLKVVMVQFLKGVDSGELESVKKLDPNFTIMRFDKSKKFFWDMNNEEKVELQDKIKDAIAYIGNVLKNEECDILILDEIMGVIKNDLISVNEVLDLLNCKPNDIEIILTGRDVPKEILASADLVTEMKMIKHPFQQGISARKGIEF